MKCLEVLCHFRTCKNHEGRRRKRSSRCPPPLHFSHCRYGIRWATTGCLLNLSRDEPGQLANVLCQIRLEGHPRGTKLRPRLQGVVTGYRLNSAPSGLPNVFRPPHNCRPRLNARQRPQRCPTPPPAARDMSRLASVGLAAHRKWRRLDFDAIRRLGSGQHKK